MIAPGAVVSDVHPLLAGTRSAYQRAVHVEDRLLEKGRGLLRPDFETGIVEGVLQRADISVVAEATTEIAGGGGIGNAARAQSVEEHLVVATQFDVLKAGAFAQGVVGQVENVVGFVVGQVNLEEHQTPIDGIDQTEATCQQVHGADAAVSDAAVTVTDLIVNVRGGEHRLLAAIDIGFVESPLDAALAIVQLSAYLGVHSKSLLGVEVEKFDTLQTPQKAGGFRDSRNFPDKRPQKDACSRARWPFYKSLSSGGMGGVGTRIGRNAADGCRTRPGRDVAGGVFD